MIGNSHYFWQNRNSVLPNIISIQFVQKNQISWPSLILDTLLFLLVLNQLINERSGGTEFRLCQGWSGTHTIDRIGILSSRTSSAYSLCNKIKFPDFLLWYILSCSYSINSSTKDPGGQNSHYLTDESEFCPPEHTQNEVYPIKSNFLTFHRIRYSPVHLLNQLCNKISGGTEFRLCQGWSGTLTIFDRIGILSSRTSSAYSLCNKIKFPDLPSY